ncbi:MAG: hypothetical protein H6697_01405 [Myxococcales bacterium]|nr:hypothetical protein [Myxococcales bacterium]
MASHRLKALMVAATLVAACGGDKGGPKDDECEAGTLCECADSTDCPTGETCDPFGNVCRPAEGDVSPDVDASDVQDEPDVTDEPDVEDVQDEEVADVVDEEIDQDPDIDVEDVDVDGPDLPIDPCTIDCDGGDIDVDGPDETEEPDVPITDDPGPPPTPQVNPWIAYVAPDDLGLDRIYLIRTDGTGGRILDTGDLIQTDPAWSWDGTQLAYRTVGPTAPVLKVVDVTTGDVRTITTNLGRFTSPSWTPGDASIVVEGAVVPTDFSDLFEVPLAGTGAVALTSTPGWSEATPRWSRLNRLVYQTNEPGGTDAPFRVVLWNRFTDETTTLSLDGHRVLGRPSVDWALSRVVYQRRVDVGGEPASELHIVTLPTEPEGLPTDLVVGDTNSQDAQLSTDGAFIVYAQRDVPVNLYILDAASGDQVGAVTSDARAEQTPAISPVESSEIELW